MTRTGMPASVFLGITALALGAYGLMCLVQPSIVAEATGMQLLTGTATVEVRAMYGGLQIGIGLLALLGALRAELRGPVLISMCLLFFGIASGRLVGIAIESDPGAYNFAALGYELASAAIAGALIAAGASRTPNESHAA